MRTIRNRIGQIRTAGSKRRTSRPLRRYLNVTLALASAGLLPSFAFAQDAARVDKVEKENQELRNRLDALEAIAKKEGILPSGDSAPRLVKAMSDITISGFVTASYFHDSSEPPASNGHISPGYLWNRVNDSFSLNKVKLTIASPQVENNGREIRGGVPCVAHRRPGRADCEHKEQRHGL